MGEARKDVKKVKESGGGSFRDGRERTLAWRKMQRESIKQGTRGNEQSKTMRGNVGSHNGQVLKTFQ